MAGLTKTVEHNHHTVLALVSLVVIVSMMASLLVQRLPAELTITKTALAAPSSASQPGLFDTLLALHPSLPVAHEAVMDALS